MKKTKKVIIRIVILVLISLISYGIITIMYKQINNSLSELVDFEGKGYLIKDESNLEDSGITGTDYTIDTTYSPYYSFLSDNDKKLYTQIYANILNLKTTFKPIVDIDTSHIKTIIEAVTNDHPELFWIDNNFSYKYTSDNICRQIILSFNDLANNYKENQRLFDEKANNIIDVAKTLTNDYEKELYVHDRLISNITYDLNSSYNQTAYSALVNSKTVCAGYSKAFQYIMNKLGIVTYYVVGTSQGENHSWNIVKLDDGYYNIDLTWDDNSSNHYVYFNLTDKQFASSHNRSSLSLNLPSCSATTYTYNNSSKKSNTTNNTSTFDNSSNTNNLKETSSINQNSNSNVSDNMINSESNDTIETDEIYDEITEEIPYEEENNDYGQENDTTSIKNNRSNDKSIRKWRD